MSTVPGFTTPSDKQLLDAVRLALSNNPAIGRPKLLARLRGENTWALSDTRLKHFVKMVKEPLPPMLPADALAAQDHYKETSTRCFRIFGRGEYDYGVTPNSDVQLHIDIAHRRLKTFLEKKGRLPPGECYAVDDAWPVRVIFDYYEAAAKKAGIPLEDVVRQFIAEYCIDPLHGRVEPTASERLRQQREYKKGMMELPRLAHKHDPANCPFRVDHRGEPIWEEEKHGRLVIIVTRINKETGEECGDV